MFGSVSTKYREDYYEEMDDIIGPNPGSGEKRMSLYRNTISGSRENGLANYFIFCSDFPSLLNRWDFSGSFGSFPSSADAAYSRMAAGTAPNRAEFSVPTFFFEGIKDFPGTIKSGFKYANWLLHNHKLVLTKAYGWVKAPAMTANQLVRAVTGLRPKHGWQGLRDLAAANLAISFGFQPFISDVFKMSQLALSIERRRKEILRLSKHGVLARRWDFAGFDDGTIEYTNVHVGQYINSPVTVTRSSYGEMWGTIRWYPTPNTSLPKTDSELIALTLGLNAGNVLLAFWEAMPWSWFIDYFTNVGEVLATTANGIQYNVAGCIMSQKTVKVSHPGVIRSEAPAYDMSLSAGVLTHVSKARDVYTGVPGLTIFGDLLSPKQLSILTSLAGVHGLAK